MEAQLNVLTSAEPQPAAPQDPLELPALREDEGGHGLLIGRQEACLKRLNQNSTVPSHRRPSRSTPAD
jgi:hypothetical protein